MGSEEPMLLKDSGCDMQVQRFGYKQKLAQRNFTKRFMTMALAVSHDVGPGGLFCKVTLSLPTKPISQSRRS